MIEIEVTLFAETRLAWLVSDTGEEDDAEWVPKSQCELKDDETTLLIPEWLALIKGFI